MRYAYLLFLLPLELVAQNVGVVPQTLPTAPSGPASEQETKPEDLGSVAGQVADASSGEPLRKANLILRRADANPNGGGIPTSYSGISDDGGKFVFKDIEPGRYRLTVTRTGYTNGEYGSTSPGRQGTILSLGKAQKLSDLTVRMTPHGVVTGRIVDRDGDPLTGVMVQLMRYMYANGRRQLNFANGNTTNDLGEYRIFGVAPGRYYVSATYREGQFEALARTGSADEDFAPTYYPGTFDVSTAAEINIAAGGQARVDLTLTKTRTIRISGRVINNVAPAASNIFVTLMPRGTFMVPFLNNRSGPVRGSNAKFELRGVVPGSYYLVANTSFLGQAYSARQAIEVGNSNIEDVAVTISSGVEIRGRVRMDGSTAAPENLQVTLRPLESGVFFSPISVSPVSKEGTFTVTNVGPDNYNVLFPGLPEGYFVKSARTSDTDILTNGLNVTNGFSGNIEIVLSPDAAEARGIVHHPQTQQPIAGGRGCTHSHRTGPSEAGHILQDHHNRPVRKLFHHVDHAG